VLSLTLILILTLTKVIGVSLNDIIVSRGFPVTSFVYRWVTERPTELIGWMRQRGRERGSIRGGENSVGGEGLTARATLHKKKIRDSRLRKIVSVGMRVSPIINVISPLKRWCEESIERENKNIFTASCVEILSEKDGKKKDFSFNNVRMGDSARFFDLWKDEKVGPFSMRDKGERGDSSFSFDEEARDESTKGKGNLVLDNSSGSGLKEVANINESIKEDALQSYDPSVPSGNFKVPFPLITGSDGFSSTIDFMRQLKTPFFQNNNQDNNQETVKTEGKLDSKAALTQPFARPDELGLGVGLGLKLEVEPSVPALTTANLVIDVPPSLSSSSSSSSPFPSFPFFSSSFSSPLPSSSPAASSLLATPAPPSTLTTILNTLPSPINSTFPFSYFDSIGTFGSSFGSSLRTTSGAIPGAVVRGLGAVRKLGEGFVVDRETDRDLSRDIGRERERNSGRDNEGEERESYRGGSGTMLKETTKEVEEYEIEQVKGKRAVEFENRPQFVDKFKVRVNGRVRVRICTHRVEVNPNSNPDSNTDSNPNPKPNPKVPSPTRADISLIISRRVAIAVTASSAIRTLGDAREYQREIGEG
jgi:hypothetical protein